MNTEQVLDLKVLDADFLCMSGSRLYGTFTEKSDYDYRGYIIPPFEYLIGNKNFESKQLPETDNTDHKIYS